eukprot:364077-Chlamydomonas_euryale.AAC.1
MGEAPARGRCGGGSADRGRLWPIRTHWTCCLAASPSRGMMLHGSEWRGQGRADQCNQTPAQRRSAAARNGHGHRMWGCRCAAEAASRAKQIQPGGVQPGGIEPGTFVSSFICSVESGRINPLHIGGLLWVMG